MTLEMRARTNHRVNENKNSEEWILKPDVVNIALEEYAKKPGI